MTWQYRKNSKESWKNIPEKENKRIEEERKKKEGGHWIYTCFGNKYAPVIIDFDKIQTHCCSVGCGHNLDKVHDHADYQLRRLSTSL